MVKERAEWLATRLPRRRVLRGAVKVILAIRLPQRRALWGVVKGITATRYWMGGKATRISVQHHHSIIQSSDKQNKTKQKILEMVDYDCVVKDFPIPFLFEGEN